MARGTSSDPPWLADDVQARSWRESSRIGLLHATTSPRRVLRKNTAIDGVRKSLQRPYTGPYLVLKTFTIQVNGKNVTVSRDRLKPAHIKAAPLAASPTPNLPNTDLRTRSGRRTRETHEV
ncbi:Hypothetical protein NTJ_10795 [Nesidiocoris tenuis]|uniref:Uncharacterized protein n=1 Tax=Nesidiocoris tenuis TaxID=355587 RepID=A0ABN7B314_9HEMI|nr:Hypothetical protein NTJ_10795 [Nesidiocoris tenuis]